jgi:radical SAM family protein/iron-sulfur cluster protein
VSRLDLGRYAPTTPLGHLKDAMLRARAQAASRLDRLSALYLEPRGTRAVIRELNFEFCSACNLRCKWCSLDSKLRAGLMKLETFRKVLEEIRDESRFHVRSLNLHHSGDSLLHPRFPDFLEAISEEKARRPGRFPFVKLLTNATHLRGEKAEAILKCDAIDWIRFSVDGGNPRDFEAVRIGAKWDQVVGNIHAFLDEVGRRKSRIQTGVISVFGTTEPEIHDDFRRLVFRVTNYMPRLPHNWVGKKDLGIAPPPEHPQGLCQFVLSQAVILYDGKVTLCCNDLNAEGVIGDLRTQSLYEVFRGEKRAHHVRLMREGRRRDLPFCGTCDQL